MPTFANPLLLWLLLLVPLLIWWELARKRLALRFSDVVDLRDLPVGRRRIAHWLGLGLRAGGLAMLLIALAGPRWPDRGSRIPTEGIAIAILMDISGSMGQIDYPWNEEKVSRIDAVKKVFRLFVDGGDAEGTRLEGRGNDLIALFPFASVPEDLCPLTLSHDVLLRMLDEQQVKMVPDESNTNIGGAIAWGLKRLDGAGTRRKVMILLSDGEHNVPEAIKPRQAAQLAHNLQVPVYTIDAGADPAPEPGAQAPDEKLVESRANAKRTMEDVARITGGKYFDARDGQGLLRACQEIDRLEPQRIESFYYRRYYEGYPWFASASLVMLGGLLALDRTIWRRVP
jgi:Ca-activated chloride channel family protein